MFGRNNHTMQSHLFDEDDEDLPITGAGEGGDTSSSHGTDATQGAQDNKRKQSDPKNQKPLLAEVEMTGGRNFVCLHCNKSFSGSYTRIHNHFFGAGPGKVAGIHRCKVMVENREKFLALRKRVEDAEQFGVSATLKHSVLKKKTKVGSTNVIKESFGMVERDAVDQAIMKFLCANGIAFNVLRSPQFHEMVTAINRAPKGYKGPSSEKARTTLLDECKRNVEKSLTPIKDTWNVHGLTIVSDGWTNVKKEPLLNVMAENYRGAMFMYGTDFSGVGKTGLAIAEYLLKSIEEVGPSNVVQVGQCCELQASRE